MNPAIALLTTVQVTSLAAGHAAETLTNSIGMQFVRIEPGHFTVTEDGPPPGDNIGHQWLEKMSKHVTGNAFMRAPHTGSRSNSLHSWVSPGKP